MTCQDFLTLPLNGVKWPQHRPIIWLTFDKQINSVPRHVANKALKSRHHNFYDLISNICVYLFQSSACGQCQQHSHNNTKWNWRCKAAVQSAHMVKKCGNQLLLRVFNCWFDVMFLLLFMFSISYFAVQACFTYSAHPASFNPKLSEFSVGGFLIDMALFFFLTWVQKGEKIRTKKTHLNSKLTL